LHCNTSHIRNEHGQGKPSSFVQAAKSERAANQTLDPEVSAGLRAMALAYRSQADALKNPKRKKKVG
jgi:hypothetical protein